MAPDEAIGYYRSDPDLAVALRACGEDIALLTSQLEPIRDGECLGARVTETGEVVDYDMVLGNGSVKYVDRPHKHDETVNLEYLLGVLDTTMTIYSNLMEEFVECL